MLKCWCVGIMSFDDNVGIMTFDKNVEVLICWNNAI